MTTTKREKKTKEIVLGKCWKYLDDNFHKLSQSNKIKIALELCKKDLPQALEHSGEITGNIIINIKSPSKILSEKELNAASSPSK